VDTVGVSGENVKQAFTASEHPDIAIIIVITKKITYLNLE
jgi:hypothetical protein